MNMIHDRKLRGALGVALALLVALLTAPAHASEFALFNNSVAGYWKTTTTIGAGWRNHDANVPQLVGAGAGQTGEYPGAHGAVGVNDDAELNYPKAWDNYSAPLTLVSELALVHLQTRQGLFVRVRGWYDMALEGHNYPHGNPPNMYTRDGRLSDEGFIGAANFSGADFYDVFYFGNFNLGKRSKMQLRIGRQTFDWGEGIFYPGIASVQPYDYAWLSITGAPLLNGGKLPVNRIYANFQLGRVNLDGFYNLEWRPSVFPGCGSYASGLDNGVNYGCNVPTAAGMPDQTFIGTRNYFYGHLPHIGYYANDPGNPRLDNRPMSGEPSKYSGYGASAHTFFESIATEVGVYYSRYTSPFFVNAAVGGASGADFSINTMYPEGVEAYALSASSGVRNLTLQGQVTRFLHFPAHYGAPTYIVGVNSGTGAMGWMRDECGPTPEHPDGSECKTWYPMNIWEFQTGGTWQFGEKVGLADATLTGEVDYQWNDNYPSIDGPHAYRLGRYGNFGEANWTNDQGYVCNPGPLSNGVVNRCEVKGFITERSWGYKLRAATSLPRGPALTFVPSVTWTQDVSGFSADQATHVEGRWQIAANLRTLYYQNTYIDIGAVWYNRSAKWDPLQDRGQYTMSVGYNW